VRDTIVRELVTNTLIHREFSMANPARLIIEKERILVENANRPHGHGLLDLNEPTPYPKNPVLAKMFHEIGYADELGSGIRNTVKYTKIYSGEEPMFIEKDIFQIVIPLKSDERKVPIGEGKVPIGDKKVPIGELKEIILHMDFSEVFVANIEMIYSKTSAMEYFGRRDIIQVLGCSDRNAGK